MSLLRVLWKLLLFAPWTYATGMLLGVLAGLLMLLPPLIVRAFFNALTGHGHAPFNANELALVLVAVQVVVLGLTLGSTYATTTAMMTTKALLRKNLFRHVLSVPYTTTLTEASGETVSRLRDDVDLAEGALSHMIRGLGPVLYGIVAFVVMLRINVRITLVIVIPLLLIAALVHEAASSLVAHRRRSRAAAGRVSGFIGEIFDGVQAIKLAAAESSVVEHLRQLNQARRSAAVQDKVVSETFRALSANAVTVGIGAVLFLAASAMRQHTFTVGDFALFTMLLGSVTIAIPTISDVLGSYQQSTVSLHRLTALLGNTHATEMVQYGPVYLGDDAPVPWQKLERTADPLQRLEARNLTFHFPESGRGIEDVDLLLNRGTMTVITGRVGSGKTTLLRVLLGLLPSEGGDVYWNGRLVIDPAHFFVPPRTGFTPQVPHLFSETLRDNVLLGLPVSQEELDEAIHQAVLSADVAQFTEGLDAVIGPRGIRISGGQRQRTAAARMFVANPELLVVDDLSSALDIDTERRMWDRLRSRSGSTILAVSHRRAALRLADQVIVMKAGHAEAAGSLMELLSTSEEMRSIWAGRAERASSSPAGSID